MMRPENGIECGRANDPHIAGNPTVDPIVQILEQRHKTTNAANPGFRVINQGSLLTASSSSSTLAMPRRIKRI